MDESLSEARAVVRAGGFARGCARAAAVTCLSLMLAGCAGGVLQPRGPIGIADFTILLDAVGIMSVIVVPTLVALVVIGWWFRASNTRARYRPNFVYSGRLEIIVWAIPVLIIMFLGGLTWIGAHELDPYVPIASTSKDAPLNVQVVFACRSSWRSCCRAAARRTGSSRLPK